MRMISSSSLQESRQRCCLAGWSSASRETVTTAGETEPSDIGNEGGVELCESRQYTQQASIVTNFQSLQLR